MSRFGPLQAVFYSPSDLSTALSDGTTTVRPVVTGWWTDNDSALGEAALTFVNDAGLSTLAARGNIVWAYKTDSVRTDLTPPVGVTFAEPFIIRRRIVGPEPNLLTVTGPTLLADLQRFTIYRPLGLEQVYNTTLEEAAAGPVTNLTISTGAPPGIRTMHIDGVDETFVGREMRIRMDDGNWFVTVAAKYVFWDNKTHLQFRDRLPVVANANNFPVNLEFRTRKINLASSPDFRQGMEITVTLNSGTFTTLVEAPADEDGFITIRNGLPGAANAGNAVVGKDYSNVSTNDVTQVMGYAPGWTTSFQTGTGTAAGTRYAGGGETVYDILRSIADETGELFRTRSAEVAPQGPKKQLLWRRTADAVGNNLRLVMPSSQSAMASDTANPARAILLERPGFIGEYDPVTQCIPVSGDSRVTLYACSPGAIAAAAAAGFTVVTTGLSLYAAPYVIYDALQTSLGTYQRKVTFSEVTVEGNNVFAIRTAADQLLNMAINYLKTHATAAQTITARCVSPVGIRAGQTVELYYESPTGEYTLNYTGANALFVQSVRREVSGDGEYPGVPITSLTLTTTRAATLPMAREVGRRLATVERLATRMNAPERMMADTPTGTSGGTSGGIEPPVTPPPETGDFLPLAGGTMTGNITFSGAQTVDGVDISAHAANASAHHAPVTAGNLGISITGQAVSAVADATRGLMVTAAGIGANIATGSGLQITSNALDTKLATDAGLSKDVNGLAVSLATNPGLEFSTGLRVKLPANSGLARDATGVYLSPAAVTATSTNSVSGANHTHAVTATDDANATVSTLLKGTAAGYLTLGGLGVGIAASGAAAATLKAKAVDDYTLYLKQLSGQTASMLRVEDTAGAALILLTGTGDLESGQPGFVSGMTGWQIAASGNAEFNDVRVRGELHAATFVADEMHATGGTLAVMTATKIAPPVGANDNTLPNVGSTFTFNVQASWDSGLNYFAAGDIVRVKPMGEVVSGGSLDLFDVYLQVQAVGTLTGRNLNDAAGDVTPGYYPMTVYRRYGGTTGLVLPTGAAAVKWGKVSGGAGTYTGGLILTSDLQYSPYIDIFTIDANQTGATWQSAPVTPTPRVRVGNLDGVLGLAEQWGIAAGTDLSDTSLAARYFVASNLGFRLQNVDLKLYNGSNPTVDIAYNGVVKFGTDTGSDTTTFFHFNPATGGLRMGPQATGKPNLYWDGTSLRLRTNADSKITLSGSDGKAYFDGDIWLGASGGIYQGTGSFASPTTGLKIYNSGGIGRLATYSGGTLQVELGSTGELLAGGSKVRLNSAGMAFAGGSAAGSASEIEWRLSGFGNVFGGLDGYYTGGGTGYVELKSFNPSTGVNLGAVRLDTLNSGVSLLAYNGTITDIVLSAYYNSSASKNEVKVAGELWVDGGIRAGYTLGTVNRGQMVSNFASQHSYNAIIMMDAGTVAHGMTSVVDTATYGALGKEVDGDGGLKIIGASQGVVGMRLYGYGTGENTTSSTAARAAVVLSGRKANGTGSAAIGSTGNILTVDNDGTTRLIVKGNGDLLIDGSQSSYDDYDDVALLRAADLAQAGQDIDGNYSEWLTYNRRDLEAAGLMDGSFVNYSRMQRLITGAIWQLAGRVRQLEER